MDNKETILQKIQKLKNICSKNGATEAEAINAAQRVQEILFKYDIDMSEVEEFKIDDKIIEDFLEMEGKSVAGWKQKLQMIVAYFYMCQCYYDPFFKRGYHSVYFIGKKMNVMIAKEMYIYLHNTIMRLDVKESIAYKKSLGITSFGPDGRAWHESWRRGCVRRIGERLEEMQQQMMEEGIKHEDGTHTSALTVKTLFEKELALSKEFIKNLNLGSSSISEVKSSDGYYRGYAVGDKISLNNQIKESTIKEKIALLN